MLSQNILHNNICPTCGSKDIQTFYKLKRVPVHSVLIMHTREEALNYQYGDISLGFCKQCGFISNFAFDPKQHEYSSEYESTQWCSPTFNAFAKRLARHLVERYDLYEKDILEIGCGQGEFLFLLCEYGNNRGIGFDPAYVEGRLQSEASERITFIKDFYSEKYVDYQADIIICKMTLEHIHQTSEFVGTVRKSISDRSNTIVFFQVPDVTRILNEIAFWDIYYEHCSYFNLDSLAYLFRIHDFNVNDIWTDYDDQYVMIETQPIRATCDLRKPEVVNITDFERRISDFTKSYQDVFEGWKQKLQEYMDKGQRIVLWGAGSKGVSFLTTLNIKEEIQYAIDINPIKHGTYMAGTGQMIVAPSFLGEYKPDAVIVMNPIYCQEIQLSLSEMGLNPELIPVDSLSSKDSS